MIVAGIPVWLMLLVVCFVGIFVMQGVVRLFMQKRALAAVVVLLAGVFVIVAFLRVRSTSRPSLERFQYQMERWSERAEGIATKAASRARAALEGPSEPVFDEDEISQQLDDLDAMVIGVDDGGEPFTWQVPMIAEAPDDVGAFADAKGVSSSVKSHVVTVSRSPKKRAAAFGTALTAIAIAAFLYIGYILLDASTRGQFTWSLRIMSLLAFAILFGAVSLIP